jgi:hypothetical protein
LQQEIITTHRLESLVEEKEEALNRVRGEALSLMRK